MIEEAERRSLWESLCDTIGAEQADTLMTMIPPQPLPDLATREDIAGLRSELQAVQAGLRAEIAGLDNKIDSAINGLDNKIDTAINGLDNKIDSAINGLRGEMHGAINGLDNKIDGKINGLRGEMHAGLERARAERADGFASLRDEIRAVGRQTTTWAIAILAVVLAALAIVTSLGLAGALG